MPDANIESKLSSISKTGEVPLPIRNPSIENNPLLPDSGPSLRPLTHAGKPKSATENSPMPTTSEDPISPLVEALPQLAETLPIEDNAESVN